MVIEESMNKYRSNLNSTEFIQLIIGMNVQTIRAQVATYLNME